MTSVGILSLTNLTEVRHQWTLIQAYTSHTSDPTEIIYHVIPSANTWRRHDMYEVCDEEIFVLSGWPVDYAIII